MKGAKSLIGIIAIVLLVCTLGGTYAWYSNFANTDFSMSIKLNRYTELLLDSNTLANIPKYNGQLGYMLDGTPYPPESKDAAYTANFDTSFKVLGSANINTYIEYDYAAIKLGGLFYATPQEAISLIFGEPSSQVNLNAYLAVRKETPFDSIGNDGYYRDQNGKYKPLTDKDVTVNFVAKNPNLNKEKKGMVVVNSNTDKVEYIVVKKAFVSEYFCMQYAYKEAGVYQEKKDISLPMLFLFGAENKEVWDNFKECKLHTIMISIGYFGTKLDGSHRAFDFGGQIYKGSTFSFALRMHGEEAINV